MSRVSWSLYKHRRRCGYFLALSAALALLCGCAAPPPSNRSGSASASARQDNLPVLPTELQKKSSGPRPASTGVEPARPAEPLPSAGWQSLFDGKTLTGWKITEFGGRGEVSVKDGLLMIHLGVMLTGVTWTNEIPKTDYEVELEAMKVEGGDFFCGLTFPVGDSFCSFIVGGWGGGVVGLSSIDGYDASENETTKYMAFDKNRWYRIRLRVTKPKIETWIDAERIVEQSIVGRKISLRPGEIEYSAPFGLATWQTTAALRHIRLRRLSGANAAPRP